MKTIKLPDRLFARCYQIIVEAQQYLTRTDPPSKGDDLQELEIRFSNYYDRIKSK